MSFINTLNKEIAQYTGNPKAGVSISLEAHGVGKVGGRNAIFCDEARTLVGAIAEEKLFRGYQLIVPISKSTRHHTPVLLLLFGREYSPSTLNAAGPVQDVHTISFS